MRLGLIDVTSGNYAIVENQPCPKKIFSRGQAEGLPVDGLGPVLPGTDTPADGLYLCSIEVGPSRT